LVTEAFTAADAVVFDVLFDEPVSPAFGLGDLTISGTLAAAAELSGGDSDYTVIVTPDDPNADGTVGISVGNTVTDAAGNVCPGDISEFCRVHNWYGFTAQPGGPYRLYAGDTHGMSVAAAHGNSVPSYGWWFEDGSKALVSVGDSLALSLDPLTLGHAGAYWCTITYDGEAYTSDTADVAVAEHLRILTAPEGAVLHTGDSHDFTVTVAGGYAPLTYTWWRGEDVLGYGPTYTIDLLEQTDNGQYHVGILDDNGDYVESVPVVLQVSSLVPAYSMWWIIALALVCLTTGLAFLGRLRKSEANSCDT